MNLLGIKYLAWDSEFFGMKIGSMNIDEFDEKNIQNSLQNAQNQGFKLIYGFQDSGFESDKSILKNLNGKLLDKKVIFEMDVNSKSIIQNEVEEYLEIMPNQDLYDLAIVSGNHSRFLIDPIFGKDKFEKLYYRWIENSVNHTFADKVFIYRQNPQIVGTITLKIHQNEANIGLLAVNPDFQGRAIGSKLIDKCIEFCQNQHIKTLTVPTQLENNQACNFYKKYGFEVRSITNVFHFYL